MESGDTLKTLPARLATVAGQVTRTSLPSDADFMRSCLAKCQVDRISPTRNRATRSLAFQVSSVGQHRMKATMSLSRSPLSQARSALLTAWDIVIFKSALARHSIRMPESRQRRSGTRNRLIFVAQILLLERVTLQFDDAESALPQNRRNSSRANSTDADVPQKLPVALESHSGRFQWLAALGHQVRHGDAQGDGQPLDVQQRDVAFAALDTTDVGPMKAGKVGQCFLRNPLLSADFPESFPKSNLYVGQDRTLCCINRLGCPQLLTAVSGIAYYRSTAFTLR